MIRTLTFVAALVCIAAVAVEASSYWNHDFAPGLSPYYYARRCPQATRIVKYYVSRFIREKGRDFAGAFNRLQFHDCWVQGCDGSVLLNSTATNRAEREAFVNFGLRGVEEIDQIKSALERVCPGVVSCADILMLSARDATVKVGGPRWPVALGRKDSQASSALEADVNLPFPVFPFPVLVQNFANKGFDAREMVVLSGGHTIGQSHCNGVLPHLYNFTGANNATDVDPTLDKAFAEELRRQCPQGNRDNVVPLDSSNGRFDGRYYRDVLANKGVLITDSALLLDPQGESIVRAFARPRSSFFREFADAMVKMANLGVLTGSQGEIRRTCQWVN